MGKNCGPLCACGEPVVVFVVPVPVYDLDGELIEVQHIDHVDTVCCDCYNKRETRIVSQTYNDDELPF